MQVVEDALIAFFEQVARKDTARLKKLEQEPCFNVEQGRWCFTLPDLHVFLQRQDDVFSRVDYKQFRKLLFNSPVNQVVKPLGAEVIIIGNRAKVDKSRYALVWQTT
ncbi:hypothetical protein MNBD_GAMMA14-2111 [hydrothermal vent metagenome]|uniref:Uncharacterized protein n=1 Tax=hydrothermal vent metagenome TaxID=652676 RepID=A0A3B0YAV4_9ZZZZ